MKKERNKKWVLFFVLIFLLLLIVPSLIEADIELKDSYIIGNTCCGEATIGAEAPPGYVIIGVNANKRTGSHDKLTHLMIKWAKPIGVDSDGYVILDYTDTGQSDEYGTMSGEGPTLMEISDNRYFIGLGYKGSNDCTGIWAKTAKMKLDVNGRSVIDPDTIEYPEKRGCGVSGNSRSVFESNGMGGSRLKLNDGYVVTGAWTTYSTPDGTLGNVKLKATNFFEPPQPVLLKCSDGIDNDGDGLIDMNDPGCDNSDDDDESNILEHRCSSPLQTIFRISDVTNAHAEVFNGAGNYPVEVCYDEIFGSEGDGDRACTGSDTILKLSDTTNAHVGGTNYDVNVCYGNLECDYATDCQNLGDLGEEYKCLASVSSAANAHAGDCNAYENKICCKAEEVAPPCEPTLGEESKELTCNDRKDNDCDNDIDCADLDCTGTEGCGCEECGISLLYFNQLFCTEQACNTLSKLLGGGCYYLKDKKCLPCSDVNSCLDFDSQSQCEFNNCNLDCEWDSQNEICFNLLCGNGEIDDGETCSSCPADAGCSIDEVCQSGECGSCSEGDICVIGCDTVDPDCDCDGSDPDCGVQPVECDNDNVCERGENCLCEDCSEPNFDDWDNLLIDGCGYGYICSEGACDCNNEIEDGICVYDESEEAVCPDDPDCFVPPDVNECFGQICSVDEFCIYDTDIVMYSEPPMRCCTVGNCGSVMDIPSIGQRTIKTHGKCLNVDSEGKGQYDVTTKIYESNNLISSETTKESCTVLIGEVPFFTFFNLILTLVILGLFYLIKK